MRATCAVRIAGLRSPLLSGGNYGRTTAVTMSLGRRCTACTFGPLEVESSFAALQPCYSTGSRHFRSDREDFQEMPRRSGSPFVCDRHYHETEGLAAQRLPDMVAERARFELANGVRPLRHFQCGLPKASHFEASAALNFNST